MRCCAHRIDGMSIANFSRMATTARADASVADLCRLMVRRRAQCVIIVDDENVPLGAVTPLDLVAALSA